MENCIVVGFDGSAPARTALRWAAEEAQRRDARLRIVAAYLGHWTVEGLAGGGQLESYARELFQALVAEAVAQAREAAPGVAVSGIAVRGAGARALLEAGRSAALTVVGNRGHGGFASLLLGSVSQQVATHAAGPVAVVRGRAYTAIGPVVVGVDGSAAGDLALGLAFEAAAWRGCALRAVRAYREPALWGVDVPQAVFDMAALARTARDELHAAVALWRQKYPTVPVETRVERGAAAGLLVAESASAGLVVV
ncbi:MAG TPA: universal stress protein, partial [Pilimelia sp.]|nr:universal stress protein [Pilimelia sp.]